jgi:Kdo2-lipid IVA lauroyltransferase/acyltransferase
MKKLRHLIEYYSLAGFTRLIRLVPLDIARVVARRLADIVYFLVPIRKKVVLENLSKSFAGERSKKEILKIARMTYQQFAQTMVELIFFPKLTPKDISEMVLMQNLPLLEAVSKLGKGAVFVGAHFGNWELMGAALAQRYPVSYVIGRQENTMVDDLLNSYRTEKGIKLIPLKMALRQVLKTLKKNEFVAILADQDAHEDGVFVDFFGRPASTPKGPALFALRSGCPLVTGHIFRENNRFRVIFDVVARPNPSGDEEKDIRDYTQSYVKILEGYCRRSPENWFWLHRRWKTKEK